MGVQELSKVADKNISTGGHSVLTSAVKAYYCPADEWHNKV